MNLPTFETITRDEALAFILSALQAKRAGIDATLRDLRSQLDFDGTQKRNDIARAEAMHRHVGTASHMPAPQPRKRRKMSAATRKRMAEAQRARWAKVRG